MKSSKIKDKNKQILYTEQTELKLRNKFPNADLSIK